jgi:hypothetical protein
MERLAAQLIEGFALFLSLLYELFVHPFGGSLARRFGVDHQPTLLHLGIARREGRVAVSLRQGPQLLGVYFLQTPPGLSHGGRHTHHPPQSLALVSGEASSAKAGAVANHHHARGAAIGLKLADVPLDGLFEGRFVAGVAAQGPHHHRQIRPALDDKLEHHLIEIVPMIPAVTLAHVDEPPGVSSRSSRSLL